MADHVHHFDGQNPCSTCGAEEVIGMPVVREVDPQAERHRLLGERIEALAGNQDEMPLDIVRLRGRWYVVWGSSLMGSKQSSAPSLDDAVEAAWRASR